MSTSSVQLECPNPYFDPNSGFPGAANDASVCEFLDPTSTLYKCSGCDFDPTQIQQFDSFWKDNCPNVINTVIFTDPSGDRKYNISGLNGSQWFMNNLLETYFDNFDLTTPDKDGYSTFQETLAESCNNQGVTPGICQNYLCENLCNAKTYSEISNNKSNVQWCGCFTYPPDQVNIYGDNISCYPLCHLNSTIQEFKQDTGEPKTCSGTVCVIDDVTINIQGGDVEGGINFNNICPSCPVVDNTNNIDPSDDPRCTCIISGVDITGTIDSVNLGSNFKNACGDNSTCYSVDQSTGEYSPVACSDVLPTTDSTSAAALPIVLIIVVVIIVVIVVLVFITSRLDKGPRVMVYADEKGNYHKKGVVPHPQIAR